MVKRGMTLTELLLAVAIMALLAGLFLPILASAREAARGASCLSNLRQLGLGFQVYAENHDDRLPDAGWFSVPPGGGWIYAPRPFVIDVEAGALYPYIGEWRIYQCPTDPDRARRLSYAMNSVVALVALAEIERPAGTLLLLEEDAQSLGGRGPNDGVFVSQGIVDKASGRHLGWGNVTWVDGHASRFRPEWLDRVRLNAAPAPFTGGE